MFNLCTELVQKVVADSGSTTLKPRTGTGTVGTYDNLGEIATVIS